MLVHFILCLFTFPSTMAFGTLQGSNSGVMNNIAKPGCQTHCGNITVPYPFGIGKDTGCFLDASFYVNCNTSFDPPKLFIMSGNLEIYNISDSELRIFTSVGYRCYDQYGNVYSTRDSWTDLKGLFTFSEKNKLTVIGCDDYALITGSSYSSGCFGLCSKSADVVEGECSGKGCCQTSITKSLTYYNVTLNTFNQHINVSEFNNCGYAFLSEEGSFRFGGAKDLYTTTDSELYNRVRSSVPVVLDWVIAGNCSNQANKCKDKSHCYDVDSFGYRCRCNQGYEGNPYLDQGCQDINECEDPRTYPCYGDCVNTVGGYNCTCLQGTIGDAKIPNNCTCPQGSYGDAKKKNGCQPFAANDARWKIFVIAIVIGLLAILCGIVGIFFGIRKRKVTRLREKFFEQNGGLLLIQKIDSQGSHKEMTLFSTTELRKATDNYSQEKIVGQGAYGVVYKGILTDKRVVAIKKSKVVDGSQAEQFINEVLILTQVIHRNVVKLLGCCLEEEVPVLVYEFISNNTLYHHIHHRLGGMSWLSWENRLRIAAEAAGALAYLHSETIMPIIHRDVKSTNILLDDNYTAKISDFGASRLVPLDHQQVTTLILGTLGYLDPQYYHTSQLTEKSDVYSFGVVLAELITGKKPIGADRINEEKNLATYFVNTVKENRLFEIVEPRLLCEGTLDKLHTLANLVKRCLSLQNQDRPTMKEVAMELDGLRNLSTHPWIPQTSQETRSLVLEVEESDLYDAPLVSYGPNEWNSYSSSRNTVFEENEPR